MILAGCGAISASAQQSPDSPSPARSATEIDTVVPQGHSRDAVLLRDSDHKDGPWKSFSEVTKGAQVQTGIFTVYRKRDNAYLSLSPSQLDRDYLLVTQLSQGIGELGLDGGSSIRSDLVRFHRSNDRIRWPNRFPSRRCVIMGRSFSTSRRS
jgi:uncharacterized protein DUF5118